MLFITGLIVLIIIVFSILAVVDKRREMKAKEKIREDIRRADWNKSNEDNLKEMPYESLKKSSIGEIVVIAIIGAVLIAIMIGAFLMMDMAFAGF
jgi:hypothetical protein